MNLVIECLLLATLFLEFYKLVLLVEHGLNSALLDHVSNNVFGLVSSDAKELSNFFESDIHVDARNNQNIVLNQCLIKY